MKRLLILSLVFAASTVTAQPQLQKDYSFVMEIPSVIAMESSPAHLYVLSGTEGMIVFRTQPEDTLQWLYSSTGMEQRGNAMTADIRFAYLYGLNRRITVLEPTSVLGVYSSTLLPQKPLDAERIGMHLYIALGAGGLGQISLSTPASVDSALTAIGNETISDNSITDLESSPSQLFALSPAGKLYVFTKTREDIEFSKVFNLSREIDRIFIAGEMLYGSDRDGSIYEIDRNGRLSELGTVGEPVEKIESWNQRLIIRGSSGRLWTSYQNRSPVLWKKDSNAGNFFTVSKNTLWLCEYNQVSRVVTSTQTPVTADTEQPGSQPGDRTLRLKPIDDITIPFSRPLLLPIKLEEGFPPDEVTLTYQSNIEDARIRGNGFYWQPGANDTGTHRFKIIAASSDGQTDSTSFNIDVRTFNAPPRFTPIRPITIPVGDPFSVPIKARDPDGMDPELVRYLGVDLPEGASINEHTGVFRWEPTIRQTGENKFKVIATDQYGAAASADIVIRVIDTKRGER